MTRGTKKAIELGLWSAGILALGYCGYVLVDGQLAQQQGNRDLDRIISGKQQQQGTTGKAGEVSPPPAYGELVGRLEIPRLNLSLIAFQGTDEAVLKRGVGHLIGSSLPGDMGNVVLAAHRDTFFRTLKDVREGDEIIMTTRDKAKRYVVDSTQIVDPEQTSVLRATSSPTLTLVTCYPFQYVGHAPKRFIVRARPADGPDPPRIDIAAAAPEPVPEPAVAKTRARANASATRRRPAARADGDQEDEEPAKGTRQPERPAVVHTALKLVELPSQDRESAVDAAEPQSATDPAGVQSDKKRRSWNPAKLFSKLSRLGRTSKPETVSSSMKASGTP